jgi:hypothetical protein
MLGPLDESGPGLQISAFDQADVACTRPLARLFSLKLDALALPKKLEDRLANSAAVKKMFDAALIADETESFVDEETCNCPGRHSRVLRCAKT